jgi:hypothetical protein
MHAYICLFVFRWFVCMHVCLSFLIFFRHWLDAYIQIEYSLPLWILHALTVLFRQILQSFHVMTLISLLFKVRISRVTCWFVWLFCRNVCSFHDGAHSNTHTHTHTHTHSRTHSLNHKCKHSPKLPLFNTHIIQYSSWMNLIHHSAMLKGQRWVLMATLYSKLFHSWVMKRRRSTCPQITRSPLLR